MSDDRLLGSSQRNRTAKPKRKVLKKIIISAFISLVSRHPVHTLVGREETLCLAVHELFLFPTVFTVDPAPSPRP
jgi:hypothetical protein